MYFVLGGFSPGREHLWAPRLITYGRGAVTCTTGWSRQTQHSSLSESVVWTRLGYFLRFGCCWYVPHCIWVLSQVHASFCAVLIGSMDGWWVIVGCEWWIFVGYECWIMIVVYAYHVCLCSLLIVVIWNWYWFFYNKLTLAILYRVVDTCDDHEPCSWEQNDSGMV